MTTLRNPVEPFGPTPVQVAKDPSNPPTGGTGVFGKTAAAIGRMGRKAVGYYCRSSASVVGCPGCLSTSR